jgi:uncharacterized protein (DUF58 family)
LKIGQTFAVRLVLLLFLFSLVAGVATGSQLYYRLTYLWGFLLVASGFMSWISLRGIQVRRSARSLRSQVGFVFEERYEIVNPGRLPRLWIEVRNESPLPSAKGSQVLTWIGGRESRFYLSRTSLQERGVFPLGPTRLLSSDLFGLFPVERLIEKEDTLLVYPPMFEINRFPNPPGVMPGGEALRRRTPQITSNAAGVREYVTGDPLNRIHWVSTARRNRLIVKEFELDPLAEVWIFVDANKGIHYALPYQKSEYDPQEFWRKRAHYRLPPSSEEYAVSIAASLGRYFLQLGRAVGLVAEGQSLQTLPADRGGRQLGKMLEALALLRAEGQLPLQGLVDLQARHLPRGSTAVLITTSAEKSVFPIADTLLRRGQRPVVVILNATSFGGFSTGDQLLASLQFLNIPGCQVSYGDDLTQAVSATINRPRLI